MKFSNSIFVKVLSLALFLSFSSLLTAQNDGEAIDTSYWYQITNMWKGDGLVLEVVEDGNCNCQLQLAAPNDKAKGQYWRFKQVKEGWYRIINRLGTGKKCLDVASGSIQLGDKGKFKSQLWRANFNGNGFAQLHNMSESEGLVLDVKNDGKNTVFMGENQGFSGQFWKLNKVRQLQSANTANNAQVNSNTRGSRGRGRSNASTTRRTQAVESNSLKIETQVLQPETVVVSEKVLVKGTELKPRTLPSDWWTMDNPLILQSKDAVLLNGKTMIPANSNMKATISKNKQEEYYLELTAIEVGGKYHSIKTNKVKINNTGDLLSPYLGSEANFEVPIETSIPIVLEENLDLQ